MGNFSSLASSNARVIRSPSAQPKEPPERGREGGREGGGGGMRWNEEKRSSVILQSSKPHGGDGRREGEREGGVEDIRD